MCIMLTRLVPVDYTTAHTPWWLFDHHLWLLISMTPDEEDTWSWWLLTQHPFFSWCHYTVRVDHTTNKNGPTQIRTGVLRTRISYAAPTPWNLSDKTTPLSIYALSDFSRRKNKGHNRNWTNDHGNCSPMLYRWAMRPVWSTMIDDFSLTRPRCWQKRPPWGSNPRPYG